MATIDLTVNSASRGLIYSTRNIGTNVTKAEVLVDLTTATGMPTGTNTDLVKVLPIPKGAHVIHSSNNRTCT